MKFYNKRERFIQSLIVICISIFGFGQTTQPTLFHDTKGNIDVNGAGQLQFTLPIALPAGIKNVAPQANLVYINSSSNGIAGYGWNIGGITSISRTGKNIEIDGEVKSIQLDYSDSYTFNGQRLVLKSGEYGRDGAEYVTEKFSNTKIKSIGNLAGQSWKGPEYWEVTFSDGAQAWYGAASSGNSSSRTPLEYNIVKWQDAQGNSIVYNYIQTPETNVSIISSIKWGGNESLGKAHFNEIEFNYNGTTQRGLIEQSYVNGISFIQDKLLNNIIVKANNSQYRKYDIIYKPEDTKYQFVDKIQEYNSENQPANPIEFERYENRPNDGNVSGGASENFYEILLTGDFSGIHKSDFIIKRKAINGQDNYFLENNEGERSVGSQNIFTNAIPITIKDANGFVSSKQGILSYSIDTATKDLLLKYYLIDFTKPANINSLYLVGTKVISHNQWDESESNYPSDPYYWYQKETTIKKLISYDVDGDGISEVLIEKNNSIIHRICTVPDNQLPTEDDCQTTMYNESRYIVVKQQDDSFPFSQFDFVKSEDVFFGDFNGDGINDMAKSYNTSYSNINGESVPVNTLYAYNFKKDLQGNLNLFEVYSADYAGLSSKLQVADFNGDGITDLFVKTNANNHYIINLNTGKNFLKIPYFNDFNSTEEYTSSQNGNYSVAKVLDINQDGKSDIVNFNTFYNIVSSTSANSAYTIKISQNEGYSNGKIKFGNNQPYTVNYQGPYMFRDIVGLRENDLYVITPSSFKYAQRTEFYYPSNLRETPIHTIKQGKITTSIEYNGKWGNNSRVYYKPVKNEYYPLMELENINSQVVSTLSQTGDKIGLFKQFRYRGLMINLHNKKMIGFRQIASSAWNSYDSSYHLINTKIWSGIENDLLNEGVPVKEWSIRTNDEDKIFPADLSENNAQLLSFKSTVYQKDKLLNGQIVTTVSEADKVKVVTAILPKVSKTKDFLTGTTSESTAGYGDYYLPAQTISKINGSYSITTSNYVYDNNPAGIGSNYFIGRPTSKTETVQAYNDIKSAKEEYTYETNQLKTLKTWNNDNTGYLQETNNYDSYGNIIEKVISNSLDTQIQTTKTEYDSKGRFIVKKTNNLGLETAIVNNDWGQIVKQTDPLGNEINNIYDGWGKLLSSSSNLEGITSYSYDKEDSNTVVTQNDPNGNISKVFTNIWGKEYKTTTKAFGQGQFVSNEIQYDKILRKIKESEPYFNGQTPNQWNTISYDDSVFPAKVITTSFNGKQIETSVSGLTTITKEINGYARINSKTNDALGNVISTTDKGGTIQFSYNATGKQVQAKYAENVVTTKYDLWGRKSEFNDPSNGIYKYEYDGFGQAKKTISPKGKKEYVYNNLGQLISQSEISTIDGGQATNKIISFEYNSKGMLVSKFGTSKGIPFNTNLTYDSQGRLLSSLENSNSRNYILKNIIYDNKSRVVSYDKELQGGVTTKVTIENIYNTWNGELSQIKDKTSGKILWELQTTNAKGQVLTSKLGAVNIVNAYNDNTGFLTGIKHTSPVKNILDINYVFNALKNELTNRNTFGDFAIEEKFFYDNNNRLISWTDPITGITPSVRNTYDIKGRILENDQIGTMKFENSTKIYQATGMTLNNSGTQNYNGDLIQSVTYNENNDPEQISGEKTRISFNYGLNNMRQRVDVVQLKQSPIPGTKPNSTWQNTFIKFYNEDGSFEVVLDLINGKEKHILYIGGNPYDSNIVYLKDYAQSSGSYKFLHKDYLGSILAISDESGNQLERRHYDAWGNFTHLKIGNGAVVTNKNTIAEASLLLDRGYTSHEHFMGVGIIHMNGRLYDPLLKRFLNADENIQDPTNTQNYNKYGYVMNNPLLYNDPTGEYWGMLIGAIVGSYFSGVQANHGNWNPVKWDWKNTWTSVIGGAFAGGAIGGSIQNISVSGTKFIQNSVVGAVGSIFNGISNGQNIFKSALIGFSGINYSLNILGNKTTSTDGISIGYRYIVSPDYNDPKEILAGTLLRNDPQNPETWNKEYSINRMKQLYPRFYGVLQKIPEYLTTNPQILNGLVEATGMTKYDILKNLDVNTPNGPVYAERTMRAYGQVGNRSVTYINKGLLTTFESLVTPRYIQATSFLLAVTVMHEFVHWGRSHNSLPTYTKGYESGEYWEMNTFKIYINKNSAYESSKKFNWKY